MSTLTKVRGRWRQVSILSERWELVVGPWRKYYGAPLPPPTPRLRQCLILHDTGRIIYRWSDEVVEE